MRFQGRTIETEEDIHYAAFVVGRRLAAQVSS